MNIALTKHFEELIARLVSSGRYNNSSEVVRAGLRILDAEEKSVAAGTIPPGSLRHHYTRTDNRAERRTAKASNKTIASSPDRGAQDSAFCRQSSLWFDRPEALAQEKSGSSISVGRCDDWAALSGQDPRRQGKTRSYSVYFVIAGRGRVLWRARRSV